MNQTAVVNHQKPPPKLFAWIASVVIVSLIIIAQFLERGDNPYLRGTGVFVLLLAGIFIFTPFYLLSKHGGVKEGQSYIRSRVVVAQGLYAITRHPQYLGYIFLGCGFALLSQHWGTTLLAIIGAIFFYLQAVREEKYCIDKFRELYKHYIQQVPRFNVVLGILRLFSGGRK